jgi:hypothetical protein
MYSTIVFIGIRVGGGALLSTIMLPVGGLHLPKVLKNTTNMFSKYNTFTETFGLGMKLYTILKAWSGRRMSQFRSCAGRSFCLAVKMKLT